MEQDSEWERFVIPNLPKLVDCLRVSLVLDHLRAKRLVVKEEYSAMRALPTEEERTRRLFEILPTKGKDSYQRFCTILEGIPGQSHIVDDILRKTEREEAAAEVARCAELHELSTGDLHNSSSARDEAAAVASGESSHGNHLGPQCFVSKCECVLVLLGGLERIGSNGGSDSTSLEPLASPRKKFRHSTYLTI